MKGEQHTCQSLSGTQLTTSSWYSGSLSCLSCCCSSSCPSSSFSGQPVWSSGVFAGMALAACLSHLRRARLLRGTARMSSGSVGGRRQRQNSAYRFCSTCRETARNTRKQHTQKAAVVSIEVPASCCGSCMQPFAHYASFQMLRVARNKTRACFITHHSRCISDGQRMKNVQKVVCSSRAALPGAGRSPACLAC